ncbi:FAD/FMN-containing dehydrogenase [Ignavibacterium album JCM 16511]|uniref:D-lactate dehydrogenase (cytochrome) n=1 Tax=Ignavibacterium album (strain DSM 19864 / JCM 16511 / NBRC 101810 / Mat9-16) TaxID=945713 RepID=I0AGT4_IGNAJ|nr:FAD-binding oxidoreductase [Ignavibacterium album]AFH48191.1 FAD/FMN-containing dehydrogenase [Ignavibacterium album JCM 16511]
MIIKTKQDELQNYLTDASNYKGSCEAVYIPQNKEELIKILKEANEQRTKVTIAGAGTGLTGARVPEEGIVISTEKLNRILEINIEEKFAIVEPAVYLSHFLDELKSFGFFYPPDPTEKNCFIGGTVATNASGAKTFKYGATRNFVQELEIVLADGNEIYLKRGEVSAKGNKLNLRTKSGKEIFIELPEINLPVTKNASGYFVKPNMDAIDLFIGSEGTLGVFTKIKLKILPSPERIISMVAFFNKEIDAISFVNKAREISYRTRQDNLSDEIDALALEFFDNNSLKFLSFDFPNIPPKANAAVWFEQEVKLSAEDKLIEKWFSLISDYNVDEEKIWFATNESERKQIEEFRHAISWKVNEYISRNNFRKLGTDVAVPDNEMKNFYHFLIDLMSKSNLDFVLYGHLGNSHFHLNILPKNENEFQSGKELYRKICLKAIELKGTVSAEHGIGKIKTQYLIDMFGEETINKMKAIKQKLDPNYILGVGNIFKSS